MILAVLKGKLIRVHVSSAGDIHIWVSRLILSYDMKADQRRYDRNQSRDPWARGERYWNDLHHLWVIELGTFQTFFSVSFRIFPKIFVHYDRYNADQLLLASPSYVIYGTDQERDTINKLFIEGFLQSAERFILFVFVKFWCSRDGLTRQKMGDNNKGGGWGVAVSLYFILLVLVCTKVQTTFSSLLLSRRLSSTLHVGRSSLAI